MDNPLEGLRGFCLNAHIQTKSVLLAHREHKSLAISGPYIGTFLAERADGITQAPLALLAEGYLAKEKGGNRVHIPEAKAMTLASIALLQPPGQAAGRPLR